MSQIQGLQRDGAPPGGFILVTLSSKLDNNDHAKANNGCCLIHCFVDECRGGRRLSVSSLEHSGEELDSG